ncbi:MAG: hypothetical protein EPO02_13305 [Nitrospirae bacterium]|nr:MAG: hypothetical protein EPO02_13305 [Nitrospirota bacterium]
MKDDDTKYILAINEYCETEPAFMRAYMHWMASRTAELMAEHHPGIVLDGLPPKDIQEKLKVEERDLYREAFSEGRNPAADIWAAAIAAGFQIKKHRGPKLTGVT